MLQKNSLKYVIIKKMEVIYENKNIKNIINSCIDGFMWL